MLLGALRGAKGLHRWREVQRGVALQLSDVEPGVQQAALKSLKVGCSVNSTCCLGVTCRGETARPFRPSPRWLLQSIALLGVPPRTGPRDSFVLVAIRCLAFQDVRKRRAPDSSWVLELYYYPNVRVKDNGRKTYF